MITDTGATEDSETDSDNNNQNINVKKVNRRKELSSKVFLT